MLPFRAVSSTWALRFESGWSDYTGEVVSAQLSVSTLVTTLAATKASDSSSGMQASCDLDNVPTGRSASSVS